MCDFTCCGGDVSEGVQYREGGGGCGGGQEGGGGEKLLKLLSSEWSWWSKQGVHSLSWWSYEENAEKT